VKFLKKDQTPEKVQAPGQERIGTHRKETSRLLPLSQPPFIN